VFSGAKLAKHGHGWEQSLCMHYEVADDLRGCSFKSAGSQSAASGEDVW
jgi:hypothetical protein